MELKPKISRYYDKISEGKDSAKLRNKLGVLYARYGQYSDAEEQFKKALSLNKAYYSPLINLGNIELLRDNKIQALSWYKKAAKIKPDNPKIIISIAMTQYELEEYKEAEEAYISLKSKSPELASKYA